MKKEPSSRAHILPGRTVKHLVGSESKLLTSPRQQHVFFFFLSQASSSVGFPRDPSPFHPTQPTNAGKGVPCQGTEHHFGANRRKRYVPQELLSLHRF